MLLKVVKKTYARHLADPASDPFLVKVRSDSEEECYRRVKMVRDLAYRSIPFIIEPAALDLITTVQADIKLVEDFGLLLLQAPLPFDSVWMEFEEDIGDTRNQSGVLIQKIGGKILLCSLHRPTGKPLIEPLLFLTVDTDAKLDIRANPFTSPRFISKYEGTHDERVSQFFGEAFPQSGCAILNAVGAMHLIAAKGGPLDAVEEPMFSRPERRRMEREGVRPAGVPPVVTKIVVNAQGRLHLEAVDDEEGGVGGSRRRAHRVRGHYLRTVKGASWRKAHVRGLGPVNETVRVVEAARDTQSSD